MNEQMSFISCRWPRAKSPKRADALAILERVIPWGEIEERLRPYYSADSRSTGRKGYSLKMMIRCWVIACVWRLTDDGLEHAVLDSLALAKFIGTDPWQPRPPSASAFRNFRHLVKNTMSNQEIRLLIDLAFIDSGLQWRQGYIAEPVFKRETRQPGARRGAA